MSVLANKALPIHQVWLAIFRLFFSAFPKVWFLSLLSALLASLSIAGSRYFSLHFVAVKPPLSIAIGMVVCFVVLAVTLMFILSNIIYQVYQNATDQTINTYESIKFVLHKYPKILLAMLLVSCFMVMGLIAFVVPGVFAGILLLFVQPMILFENKGILDSISGSAKLVWKDWWRTLIVFLPLGIIGYFATFLIRRFTFEYFWVYIILNVVVLFLMNPLSYSFLVTQYNDLKLRKGQTITTNISQ
ncbi:MAG: hypothetical protein M1561_06360 [Gammaproteobacteria bacterium]|nr:hypothetical protein [Gammaproteobacteria bacterium]